MSNHENDNDLIDFIIYYRKLTKEAKILLLGFMQGMITWDSSMKSKEHVK